MLKKNNALLFLALLFSLAFVVLSIFVIKNPIPDLDRSISLAVQKYHSDWFDQVMLAISFFGELPYSLLMVVIVAVIFFRNGYKREAFFISSILWSGLLILLIKNMVNRPRPTQFYVRLVEINRFHSFPSGHVLSYVLFFGFMIVLMQTLKTIPKAIRNWVTAISIFYGTTIAFSRIYLGAHWFTDTLGGLLLGLTRLILLCQLYFKKRRVESV